jgi:hypothetical protein
MTTIVKFDHSKLQAAASDVRKGLLTTLSSVMTTSFAAIRPAVEVCTETLNAMTTVATEFADLDSVAKELTRRMAKESGLRQPFEDLHTAYARYSDASGATERREKREKAATAAREMAKAKANGASETSAN